MRGWSEDRVQQQVDRLRRRRLLQAVGETPPAACCGVSARERRFLHEAEKLAWLLDSARGELVDAIAMENVETTIAASRRVYSIGVLLYDNCRKSGADL